MEIQAQLSEDKKVLTLTLLGKFDYTWHQEFQAAYENLSPPPEKVIMDVLEVISLDSSALGMLLLLRKFCGDDNADIKLINAKPDIYTLMHSCKFDELFVLETL